MKIRLTIGSEALVGWLSVVMLAAAAGCSREPRPTTVTEAGTPTDRMEITRAGSQPAAKGSADNFVGDVTVEPLFGANAHRHAAAASVRFSPGARTAWHSHPGGQTLVVTSGTGWVQEWGGKKQELKPGDVVWTPPGVKHWHGATASDGMAHLAIQESVDGKVVDWMEQVSDDEYRK